MTWNEIRVIYNAIQNAKNAIEELATDDYPYSEIKCPIFNRMHSELKSMFLALDDLLDTGHCCCIGYSEEDYFHDCKED